MNTLNIKLYAIRVKGTNDLLTVSMQHSWRSESSYVMHFSVPYPGTDEQPWVTTSRTLAEQALETPLRSVFGCRAPEWESCDYIANRIVAGSSGINYTAKDLEVVELTFNGAAI